jgi:hypothetical protein
VAVPHLRGTAEFWGFAVAIAEFGWLVRILLEVD